MIWTTTPWTLTANLGVAVHPHLDYKAISYKKNGEKFVSILVTERIDTIVQAGGLEAGQYSVSKSAAKGG